MHRLTFLGLAAALTLSAAPAYAQQTSAPSDSAYIAKIRTGAPAAVVAGATIVEMQPGGAMRTVQTGSNGFTCMMLDAATPMCADQNAMAWAQAYMMHSTPPNSVGFVYMLAGDGGASNTDPYAKGSAASNHWVKTGPHVMIVGPAAITMGYPATADPDPTKPFVMWQGTPYAHLMIPVSTQP
jgi:hypothetical protein